MPKEYIHKVHYHETDKMGITHHSNYLKWMEEARIDFLDQIGFGYDKMEADGIISPVTAVECRYKQPTTFGDEVMIQVGVEEFRGVRLVISYTMTKVGVDQVVLTGKTEHCFLNQAGQPIMLRRQFPALDKVLREMAAQGQD